MSCGLYNPFASLLSRMHPDFIAKMLATPPRLMVISDHSWVPGAAIQAQSRINRKMTKPAPQNQYLDLLKMTKFIDRDAVDGMFTYDRIRKEQAEKRRQQFNFVEALQAAVSARYADVDMSSVVLDPLKEYPQFVASWIFGPRGEFTNFAVVEAFNDGFRRIYRHARDYGSMPKTPMSFTLDDVPHIEFQATLIYCPHDNRRLYDYGGPHDEPLFYIQFKTYDDYAAWEELAGEDQTHAGFAIGDF